MDEKRRSKRKSMDDGFWDCSVCTYRNTPEAFKCEMCDVRKGTSTRKPRLNPQLVAQQVAQQFPPAPPPKKERAPHRLRNVERTSFRDDSDSLDNSGPLDGDQQSDVTPDGSFTENRDLEEVVGEEEDEEQEETLPPPPPPPPVKEPVVKKPPERPTPSPKPEPKKKSSNASTSGPKKPRTPRLKNIDRSSGRSMEVTVGDLTVIITDYKPKKDKNSASQDKSRSTAQQKQQQQQQQQQQQHSDSGSSQGTSSVNITPPNPKPEMNGQMEVDNKTR